MSTIEVELDDDLLAAVDAQAAQTGADRSTFIQQALRDHLHRLHIRELEEQERLGYERIPDTVDDDVDWLKLLERAAD